MASYVMLVARHTGWSEDFILWELPLVRGNAYCHAIMRLNNVKTQLTSDGGGLRKAIDAI